MAPTLVALAGGWFAWNMFLDIALPQRFTLEVMTGDGSWIFWAEYEAEMFGREEDGTYVCAGQGGSPMFLRCVRQEGSVLYVVDGTGDPYTYRLRPMPDRKRETRGPRTPGVHR